MKSAFCYFVIFIFLGVSSTLLAADCSDLTTDAKIKQFIKKAKESSPLQRKKLSARLEIKPCEGKVCLKKNKKKRKKKQSLVHSLKFEEENNKNKRFFFLKGEEAPKCMITRQSNDYRCDDCNATFNDQCRKYKSADDSTTIQGTNIDTADLELLDDDHHTNICVKLAKKPKYFKIIGKRISGDSPYEIVESYYEKKREIPIVFEYYANDVLRKIYRFFPKYYVKVEGEWMSTLTRVRTTRAGKEKSYAFETLVQVQKKRGTKKYLLYLNPLKDPELKLKNLDQLMRLFVTN